MKENGLLFLECHLAGRQYHDVDEVWDRLEVGTELRLERDFCNDHDENAVAVMFDEKDRNGDVIDEYMLGYIPGAQNEILAKFLDMGWSRCFSCRISKMDPRARYENQIRLTIHIKECEDTDADEFIQRVDGAQKREPQIKLPVSVSTFGYRLLLAMSSRNGEGDRNVLISPARIQAVMTLLSNWMTKEMRTDVFNAIGCSETEDQFVNRMFADRLFLIPPAIEDECRGEYSPVTDLTTLMMYQEGLPLKQDNENPVNSFFRVSIQEVDFGSPDLPARINRIVEKASHGLIKDAQAGIDAQTRALLMDILYFKAKWSAPFNEECTKAKIFYGKRGKSRVETMSQTDSFDYSENEVFQTVKLDLIGCEIRSFSMMIYLPKRGHSILDLLEMLDSGRNIPDMQRREVHLQLPHFEIVQTASLKEILSKIGLTDVLSSRDIIPELIPGLWFDDIIQQEKITVNETGVEAAVATYCRMTGSLPFEKPKPIEMNVNHEFLYEIVEEDSGLRLFSGIVNQL